MQYHHFVALAGYLVTCTSRAPFPIDKSEEPSKTINRLAAEIQKIGK